jgi:hypothetical protein
LPVTTSAPAEETARRTRSGKKRLHDLKKRVQGLKHRDDLSMRVQDEGSSGGLEGLSPRTWLDDAKLAPGLTIDGVATEQITGKADAVAIRNDVIGLTEQFGAGDGTIDRLEGDASLVNSSSGRRRRRTRTPGPGSRTPCSRS